MLMPTPKISVIICSIEAGKFARVCESYRHLLRGHDHEIIGIHDAKSLAEGYTRGISQATGDILVFSHDDILLVDDAFADKIIERLKRFDLLGFAGTSRLLTGYWFAAGQPDIHGAVAHARPKHPFMTLDVFGIDDWPAVSGIKAIDGLCMIATREVAEQVGFDADTFDGFHLYDIDFSFSAWRAGFKLGVCCDLPIIHESAGNFDQTNQAFQEKFILKHHQAFDEIRPGEILSTKPRGRGVAFRSVTALREAWQPDILQRATVALRRPDLR